MYKLYTMTLKLSCFLLLSPHPCQFQRGCFCAPHLNIPTLCHTEVDPTLLPWRRHQIWKRLHTAAVTSVVFSDACSDSRYAGHHLLCPLLTTMPAKSWSQTEWTFLAESRLPQHPFMMCCLLEDFDGKCLRHGRRQEGCLGWGHHWA